MGNNHLLKIMLIGNSGVGKTCILSRFSSDSYNQSYISTVGIDFRIKTIEVNGKVIKLQIWDTAGQERFQSITSSYYRGAMGFLLVYDITDSQSFDCIGKWLRKIEENANEEAVIIILGNKCDLENEREIGMRQAQEIADRYRIPFMETSTKSNINIERAFNEITRMILDNKFKKMNPNPYMPTKDYVPHVQKRLWDRNQNNRRDRCC